ncbi:MAG: hypothetical protein GYA58_04035 [Anaerolineaceae bacterium]|nr:hypothetical protein [Anaerolineaceae bacterium]
MDKANIEEQTIHEITYEVLLERLRQLGYEPGAAAFGVTWSQLALILAGMICQHGSTAGDLSEERLDECLQKASEALQNQEILPWDWLAKVAMENVVFPAVEPENDDEGPLTEAYENWSRIEDGWLDAAFEERFELDDF